MLPPDMKHLCLHQQSLKSTLRAEPVYIIDMAQNATCMKMAHVYI